MIENWLNIKKVDCGQRKCLYVLTEKHGGRNTIQTNFVDCIRSHYQSHQQTIDDIEKLGFPCAAAILREHLPQTKRMQSGEMGEILATEFIEHQTEFKIPVRRLRYKDGREVPMRGDDFLGIKETEACLYFLKGEAKSGQSMAESVITKARTNLNANNGLPTMISLLFISERLMEGNEIEKKLGRRIRSMVGEGGIQAQHVTHGLFTLTGNDKRAELKTDIEDASEKHNHISVNLQINDHQEFIAWMYKEVENLGND